MGNANIAAQLESHRQFHIEDNLRARKGFVAPARRPSGGAIVARVFCGRFSMGGSDLLRLWSAQ
jgi:hypothetical protein